MRSSTNAVSPAEWTDEIALEADPRLTLRIIGSSDLVIVLCVGGLEALLQYAWAPSGTMALLLVLSSCPSGMKDATSQVSHPTIPKPKDAARGSA